MSIEPLENLVRIRKLKQEAPDQAQIDGTFTSVSGTALAWDPVN